MREPGKENIYGNYTTGTPQSRPLRRRAADDKVFIHQILKADYLLQVRAVVGAPKCRPGSRAIINALTSQPPPFRLRHEYPHRQ